MDAWETLEALDPTVDYTAFTCVAYASTSGGSRWPASKYAYTMRDVLERLHIEVQYTHETFTRFKLYATLLDGGQAPALSRAIDRIAALRRRRRARIHQTPSQVTLSKHIQDDRFDSARSLLESFFCS